MAESPDGKGVLLFGGSSNGNYENRILELRAGGLEWARSRKKYWTRRSFEGALDSLKYNLMQVHQMEKILANLRKDVMSACKDGGG